MEGPRFAWTPIRYPRAIWDDQPGRWVSDAQITEVPYTAFTSRTGQAMTARLIVRRIKDLNRNAASGQGELFTAWRYHAVSTGSPFETLQAEEQHRGHAQAEQVFADWTDGPSRTCHFSANAAWLGCAVLAHNLTWWTALLGGVHPDTTLTVARTVRHRLLAFPWPDRQPQRAARAPPPRTLAVGNDSHYCPRQATRPAAVRLTPGPSRTAPARKRTKGRHNPAHPQSLCSVAPRPAAYSRLSAPDTVPAPFTRRHRHPDLSNRSAEPERWIEV